MVPSVNTKYKYKKQVLQFTCHYLEYCTSLQMRHREALLAFLKIGRFLATSKCHFLVDFAHLKQYELLCAEICD